MEGRRYRARSRLLQQRLYSLEPRVEPVAQRRFTRIGQRGDDIPSLVGSAWISFQPGRVFRWPWSLARPRKLKHCLLGVRIEEVHDHVDACVLGKGVSHDGA